MEKNEIIALFEQALDARLNDEALGTIIDKKIQVLLKPVDKGQVRIGEVPDENMRPQKITFSQFLGDIRRAAAQGRDGGLKWLKPDQLVSVKTGIDPAYLKHVTKDLYEGAVGAGGYLVPTEESRELINIATENYSVVPGLCRPVPMRTNQITFPTLTGGLTAYWIPETGSTSSLGVSVDGTHQTTGEKLRSDITLANLTITAYVCAVVVVVSNQLLDDSDPGVDAILRSLFSETLGDAWDNACLNGAGTALDPISGLHTQISTNRLTGGAVFDWDDVLDILYRPLHQDSKSNVQVIGNTYSELVLMKVKDTNGQYMYKAPTQPAGVPTVWGRPLYRDGNIGVAYGTNADKTRLFSGDFRRHGFAGNRAGVTIRTNPFGEPYFSFNQTAFLAEIRVGFNVDHEKYFAEMEGVPIA